MSNVNQIEKLVKVLEIEECQYYISQITYLSSLINSSLEIEEIKKLSTQVVMKMFGCEAASLLLYDEKNKELFFDTVLGEKGEKVKTIRLKLGQGIAGWVAENKKSIIVNDVQKDPRFFKFADKKSGFTTKNMICIPITSKNKVLGVFQALNKEKGFTENDLKLLESIGNQIAIALENAILYSKIKETLESIVFALAEAVEKRDKYTGGHTKRVTKYSLLIGKSMALPKKDMYNLKMAAILHDIGKIAIPDNILNKKGKLTKKEFEENIKIHPVAGEEILRHVPGLEEVTKGIKYHNERWDGKGYPEGLKGEEIPLLARIISVADAFDAMTSSRPYNKVLPLKEAFKEIEKHAGDQFDPDVVKAFLRIRDTIEKIYPILMKENNNSVVSK